MEKGESVISNSVGFGDTILFLVLVLVKYERKCCMVLVRP